MRAAPEPLFPSPSPQSGERGARSCSRARWISRAEVWAGEMISAIRILIVVVTVATCCLIAVRFRYNTESVIGDKLERIQLGMAAEEVAAVMTRFPSAKGPEVS